MADRSVLVRLSADVSNFNRNISGAAATTNGLVANLEAADGRMAALVQTGMALAPALVPIGGLAVPAIAGLTTQLGFAALAAGTAVVAFQGVGETLKAVNDFQITPTAENFAKMQEELDKLGPAGQEFVLYLQELRPQLQGLQDMAQAGLLPGVEAGIDGLLKRLPQVERIFFGLSKASGQLAADAGESLGGPEWDNFFTFLETEAQPTLVEFGRTVGDFVLGFSNMVVALNPLADDFTGGLSDMARSYAEWSAGLDSNAAFQDFVGYIQSSGPAAMEALGSLGNALIQLVQAAAPVGRAVLPVIEALGDGLAGIADSPVGPVLLSTAAAVGVLGRSMALLRVVGLRGDGTSMLAGVFAVDKIKAGAAALGTVTRAQDRAQLSATQLMAVEEKRASTVRAGVAQLGKNTALLGGLAIATTGVAEKTGLANAASFALMGTLGGPWGAAVGGAVGLTMDLAAADNDLADATQAANAAMNSLDMTARVAGLEKAAAATDSLAAAQEQFFDLGAPLDVGADLKVLVNGLTGVGDAAKQSEADLAYSTAAMEHNLNVLSNALQGDDGGTQLMDMTNEQLTKFANDLAPAAAAAGLDLKDILTSPGDVDGMQALIDAQRDYVAEMDSAGGKSRAVSEALADMRSEIIPTEVAADALGDALDALFSSKLDQGAATDAWASALRDMRKAINEVEGGLLSNGAAALYARDAMRSYVGAALDKVQADAAADGNGSKTAATLLRTRDNLISTAKAAGATKVEIRDLVKQMGLAPDNLSTIIMTPGVLNARQQVKGLQRLYELTPKEVRTLVSEAGSAPTAAKVRSLSKLYNLTPKQVRTFLEAIDNASAKSRAAQAAADKVNGIRTARLAAQDHASNVISHVEGRLAALDGDTATTYINTVQRNTVINKVERQLGFVGSADGNVLEFYAAGGLRPRIGDQQPQLRPFSGPAGLTWSEEGSGPWEAFISGHPGKRDRSRGIADDVVTRLGGDITWMADGGLTGRRDHDARRSRKDDDGPLRRELHGVRQALRENRDELRGTKEAMRDLKQQVRDSFNNEIFGNGVSGLMLQLRADANDARSMRRQLRQLDRKGLDGPLADALASSGDLSTATQLANMSRQRVRAAERAYGQRTRAQNDLAGTVTRDDRADVRQLHRTIDRLEKRLRQVGKDVERGSEKGTRKGQSDRSRGTSQRRRARR